MTRKILDGRNPRLTARIQSLALPILVMTLKIQVVINFAMTMRILCGRKRIPKSRFLCERCIAQRDSSLSEQNPTMKEKSLGGTFRKAIMRTIVDLRISMTEMSQWLCNQEQRGVIQGARSFLGTMKIQGY